MIVDEFDEMLAASRDQPLVMSIIVHSFISGQPFRLRALTRALEHIAARGERDLAGPARRDRWVRRSPTGPRRLMPTAGTNPAWQ